MRKFFLTFWTLCLVNNLIGQVNPQNGSANYEIPMFAFSDPKSGLATSVSLTYTSGNGLLVGSRASNTGQNWSLMSGGFVQRIQVGEPDDQNSTSLFPAIDYTSARGFNKQNAMYDEDYQSVQYSGDPYSRNYIDNYYPNGFIYSEFPNYITDELPYYHSVPRELAFQPRFKLNWDKRYKLSRRALTDKQQDIFIVNVGSLAAKFVIGKNGTATALNDSKIVIDFSTEDMTALNIRTRIKSFTITDENGVVYKFEAYETSEVMQLYEKSSDGYNSFIRIINSGQQIGKYTIQKWLLTEIINPLTQEKILFEYESFNIDYIVDKIPTYYKVVSNSVETVQVYEQRARGTLKRIKYIYLPDSHKVGFLYENIGGVRPDIPEDIPLTQIDVSYNNSEIYSYKLRYGYFQGKEIRNMDQLADPRFARLCLKTIQKTTSLSIEPVYKFNYYTGIESSDPNDVVPPFDCLAQDYWGYYNKASNINVFLGDPSKEVQKDLILNGATYRQPSPGTAKWGLIKSIETPLGGKISYEYEQNESKNADNPGETKYMGGVRVSKTITHDGISANSDIIKTYYYKLVDGTTSGWGYENLAIQINRQVRIWNVAIHDGYKYGGINKFDITTAMIKFFANKVASKAFSLAVKAAFNAAKKAGTLVSAPIVPDAVTFIATMIISGLIDRLIVLFNPTDYEWTEVYNYYPFQVSNPIGVNYSRIEEVISSPSQGIGKTVYEFTAPLNVRSEIPALTLPYSAKQRFAEWKYGLPRKTQIYNQTGVLLKEVINEYGVTESELVSDNHKSCKIDVNMLESTYCNSGNINAIPLTNFVVEYYYPKTGKAILTKTIENNYGNTTGNHAHQEIDYTYNNDNLNKTVVTQKGNGDLITVKNYYTNDYDNISTAITEMKSKNMLTVQISTEIWLTKGGADYLIDATINEYTKLNNGEIKLTKVYKLETAQPVPKSIIQEQRRDMLVRNTDYFKEKISHTYDNVNGLLIQSNSPEGKVSSKIYDYNNRYVVADISNAYSFEAAYTSFETNQKGGWLYSSGNEVVGDYVTGARSFVFNESFPEISMQWITAKPGKLTFWAKGGALRVSHSAYSYQLPPVKTLINSATGWTFYEYNFSGTGTITIRNNIDAIIKIDELRIYPETARMATTTYDTKVGKISECDINNRIIYYEYDGLNRLQYVRDDRKNILKKICYNFAGEVANCIDMNDVSAQWRPTGDTRCVPCPANGNYNSGVKEKMERDANPNSPTFNNVRWVNDPSGTCPTPANWVATSTYCELLNVPPYGNSGNLVTVMTDINPCSPTYNQTQYVVTSNPTACSPTPQCNPPCVEPQYKCINGNCVLGIWSIIKVKKLGKNGPWECTYAYCFPDGSVSNYAQVSTSSTACTVTCF